MSMMKLGELSTYHRNARRGNLGVITESLTALGQYRPIVVNLGTHTGRPYEVLAGNQTLAAATRLGWPDIDVHLVDVDDEKAARIVLVDNRANDLAVYDESELADLLASLPTLEATGWTDEERAALRVRLDEAAPELNEPTGIVAAESPWDADPVAHWRAVVIDLWAKHVAPQCGYRLVDIEPLPSGGDEVLVLAFHSAK